MQPRRRRHPHSRNGRGRRGLDLHRHPEKLSRNHPQRARRSSERDHHRCRQHGRGIATRAIAGGNEVEIVDRDPAEARKLAEELGGPANALQPDAPFRGEVVVFAVYYPGIKDAVQQYADRLGGKVVVDITNPVDTQTWNRLATEPGSSSAEEVAQLVPQGTHVVKAFNTTFAGTLVAGEVDGQQLDVLIAGDDEEAKQKVSQLVSDGGLRPLDRSSSTHDCRRAPSATPVCHRHLPRRPRAARHRQARHRVTAHTRRERDYALLPDPAPDRPHTY